ncbi:hypothetical protein WH96_19820 [Kiloniella spongiae]|uniref:Uncharacterized protein n=1 Tax=Kiloniella spongiae TaxID=1489064 RepID=A0A0H2M947_9PROT|nr:hypothetical protein [Kiloniella spongiae]KLN59024.1 hypothetical protein WH96_19820 [Kiloniella spongiae]
MNKVRLPLATTPTAPSSTTQTAQASTLANYPPTLTNQKIQEQLSGTIKGQTPQGQLLVQTLLGELSVNTNVKLPAGTEVIVQFRTHRPPFEVLIIPKGDKTKNQPGPIQQNPTDKLSLTHQIQATLISKPAASASVPLPKTLQNLQAAAQFPVKMEVLGPPPKSAAPQVTSGITPSMQHSTSLASQSSAPASSQPLTSQLATVLKATVTGSTQGNPIVQTAIGTIQLAIKASLPVGTQISLTLLSLDDPEGIKAGDGSRLPTTPSQPGQDLRQVLQSALTTLGQHGQMNALASHLPQKGSALTSGILLFLNALKSGTPRGWAGEDTLSLLRAAGRPELAQQLSNESTLITRPVETGQGEWRMTQLPILHDSQLHQANLFVRDREHDKKGRGNLDREEVTRFKLEVEMSRDGEMQFDGLVKKGRFDLVIRSRNNLPRTMEVKISDLFYGANEATGFAGKLTFEVSDDWEKLSQSSQKLIAGSHNSTMA